MLNTLEHHDVIVIGGGLAGLTAATYLGREGLNVRLLERSQLLGGRAMTKTQEGFSFNLGPHALYVDGKGIGVLEELGVPINGEIVNGDYHTVLNNEIWSFPMNPAMIMTSRLFSFSEKLSLIRLFVAALRAKPTNHAHQSVQEWLNERAEQPLVQQFFRMAIRLNTYANAPEEMSAGAWLYQFQIGMKGVKYLHHGWQSLVDGLVEKATQVGVQFEMGAKIAEVVIENGQVQGVEFQDGHFESASSVILAIGPQQALKLVSQSETMQWGHYAQQAKPIKAATMELGLRRLPNPAVKIAIGMDAPLYFSVHSDYADLAPDNQVMVHVAKYLPVGQTTDAATDKRELEAYLDLIQPGWRDAVIVSQYLPHITVANALATAEQGGLRGFPTANVAEVSGLALAGDWIGDGGLLADVPLTSGQMAAKTILAQVVVAV